MCYKGGVRIFNIWTISPICIAYCDKCSGQFSTEHYRRESTVKYRLLQYSKEQKSTVPYNEVPYSTKKVIIVG